MRYFITRGGVIGFVLIVLAACSSPAPILEATNIAQVTAVPTLRPASTATPAPTSTSTPTATPTNTPTPTPTPNPLEVEWMRQQIYPGSALTIEQELAPAPNYKLYVASYQSDGNRNYGLLAIPTGEKPPTGWPAIIFNHGYIPPDVYSTTESSHRSANSGDPVVGVCRPGRHAGRVRGAAFATGRSAPAASGRRCWS